MSAKRAREVTECVVCMVQPALVLQRECGHVCVCITCAFRLVRAAGTGRCPLCRMPMLTPLVGADDEEGRALTAAEAGVALEVAKQAPRGEPTDEALRALEGLLPKFFSTELQRNWWRAVHAMRSRTSQPADLNAIAVRVLQRHTEVAHVQRAAVAMLTIRSTAAGAAAAVGAAIRYPRDDNLSRMVSGLLRARATIEKRDEGELEHLRARVVALMRSHPSHAAAQRHGCRMLRALTSGASVDAMDRDSVLSLAALALAAVPVCGEEAIRLLAVLSSSPHAPRQPAAAAVAAVLGSSSCADDLVAALEYCRCYTHADACAAVRRAMAARADNEGVQAHGADALHAYMVAAGAVSGEDVAAVTAAITAFPKHRGVQHYGLVFMKAAVSLDPRRVACAGGLETLILMAAAADSDEAADLAHTVVLAM